MIFGDKIHSLKDLCVHELKDLFDAENYIVESLPKMIDKATAPELQTALREHLEVTRRQVNRLEQAFANFGVKPERGTCAGLRGIVKEGDDVLSRCDKGSVCDAAIIESAQKIEHYEISAYGTVCAYAKDLGDGNTQSLLGLTLDEEKAADRKLTEIATSRVNLQAMRGQAAPRPSVPPEKAR